MPSRHTTITGRRPSLSHIAAILGDPYERYPEGHELAGQIITAPATCAKCGSEFRQSLVSEAKRESFPSLDGLTGLPVFCNPCERRDLSGGDRPAVLPLSHSHRVVLLEQAQHGHAIHDYRNAAAGEKEDE